MGDDAMQQLSARLLKLGVTIPDEAIREEERGRYVLITPEAFLLVLERASAEELLTIQDVEQLSGPVSLELRRRFFVDPLVHALAHVALAEHRERLSLEVKYGA